MSGCSIQRGLWSVPGVPHRGWECIEVEDLREDDPDASLETCEMCQFAQIRFVHVMMHADYSEKIRVGWICAANMEMDYVEAERREKKAHARAGAKARWLSRRWRISQKGNRFLNARGVNVVVYQGPRGGFSFRVDEQPAARWYDDENEAKLAAFEHWWKATHVAGLE